MSQERWFRRGDVAAAFDWSRAARDLDVPLEVARALYAQVMRVAPDAEPEHAEALYLRWLRAAAAAGRSAAEAAAAPVPGRRTRVMPDPGKAARARQRPGSYQLDPGRWTRAMFEADDAAEAPLPGFDDVQRAMGTLTAPSTGAAGSADALVQGALAGVDAVRQQLLAAATRGRGVVATLAGTDPATAVAALRALRTAHVPGHATPALRLVARADDGDAARLLGRGSSGMRLPADLAARLGPHVGGEAADAARLHTGDTADLVAAAHHAHAVTLGDEIYFAQGAYAPGTARGDELLAHELTHVAQGRRGELARAAAKGLESGGTLDPSEAEADLRAKLAVIQLHPPTAAAPPLAAPSGQPTSDGDRAARIAAQRQRLDAANQPSLPEAAALPPPTSQPQAPVAHTPPPMAPAPAPASTGNAYIDAFQAPPSKQATELWAKAGPQATTKASAEKATFDAALAPMPVVLDGGDAKGAKGGGASHAAKRAPVAGARPPAAQPSPTPLPPPVTAGAAIARAVTPVADKAQMKADGQKAIDALPTSSPDVKADPGPAPVTDLAGQADPVRTLGDQQHAIGEGAKALDAEKAKVLAGPGAAQVQPAKLDDKLRVPTPQAIGAMPALPSVEGMAKLKKWNLPSNAQAAFDAEAKPKLDARLAEARTKMGQADVKRDVDRSKAVTDSQAKVKQAHVDADKQQQTKVASTRSQIANHQADTLLKQETEVKKLDKQSGDKKTATISKIDSRIQADQSKVQGDYDSAQKKAEDQKKQGDDAAAKKKAEAQNKKQDEHWWDKAADAVVDGIKQIAEDIDKALDAVCKAIGELLDAVKDAACKLIDAARDFVCQALTEFGDWLKSAVTALIGSVFPELAAALNRLIDEAVTAAKAAVTAIADGLKKAVTALCDSLKGAIDAVIAAFKAAVQAAATFAQAAITGDWALVGKMILEGILKMLGIDPAAFYALIGKAEDSIEKIVENPGAFVHHLVDAVKQFGGNFLDHLKDGVVQWLFGTFAQAGITMPARFDIAGVFDLAAQVMGLTWARMRGKVVKVIGEKNTARLELVEKYVQSLMTGGFAGLWEQIQQDMSGLWDMVIGGVKSWLFEKVVQQAVIKIATMWNPAGAIFQLIETAWNVYQWVRENAQRIFGLVQAVVDSVSNIVAGNIAGAANFIEASLAKLVPIAISLFANLLGLGGIADKIRGIIEKVQTKVDQAIDKLIDRVLKKFKGKDGKDAKDGDHKDGAADEAEVPKSLAEPHKATLSGLSDAVLHEAARTPSGTVLYTGGTTDPKAATKAILAGHADAKYDKASGVLHLPPVHADTSPSSLQGLAAELGRSTGVPKVTFVTAGKGWRLDGQINPTVGLASYDGAAGGRLDPLIHAMAPEAAAGKTHASRAVLEAICRERGAQFNTTVHIASALRTGTSPVTFTEKTAPEGQPAEHYQVEIALVLASDAELNARAGAGNTREQTVNQRGGSGSDTALVNIGPNSMAANPAFEADASAFEDRFGALAWGHGAAIGGAADMAAKAKAYIQLRVGGDWDAANEELADLCAQIGSTNPGWSGAAGKAVHQVMACLDSGNIAERMNHVGEFFIHILGEDLVTEDAAILKQRMAQAKLDVKALMKTREAMEAKKAAGGTPMKWDIAPVVDGSQAEDQWHTRADRADAQGVDRADREGRSAVGRSTRKIGETGATLSPREQALHEQAVPGWDPKVDVVRWEEGTKIWVMNERDKWVQWQRKLSIPLGAGPSGTTNQLMQAASALKVEMYAARAACIAYLLPAHHHTLVEILAAASAFGCTYTAGQKMYRKISPFSEAELRSCGKDNKFPDEVSGDHNAKDGAVKLVLPSGGATH